LRNKTFTKLKYFEELKSESQTPSLNYFEHPKPGIKQTGCPQQSPSGLPRFNSCNQSFARPKGSHGIVMGKSNFCSGFWKLPKSGGVNVREQEEEN
jgi:hypothetical protein